MSTLAFDTHKAVKALKEAGFDDTQAEAVVATVGDAIGGDVATKSDTAALKTDIAEFKAELKGDIAEVKAELKGDIAALKTDIAEVKAELKGDIAALKTDIAEVKAELKGDVAALKTDIAEFKAEIYRHLWLMAAGIVGLTVTLVKLIP